MPEPFRAPLVARKAESLEAWQTAEIDGKLLLETLAQRIPTIYVNSVPFVGKLDGKIPVVAPMALERKGGTATAVPVAEDGYFLTAGHVVRRASLLVLVFDFRLQGGRAQVQHAIARTVWEPKRFWFGGPDLAIVHADVGTLAPFTIAAEPPRIEDQIVTAGSRGGVIRAESERLHFAAGRILSVTKQDALRASPAFVAVRHDAPTVSGDSGGPVLDRKGNLIGISVTGHLSMRQWLSILLNRGRAQLDMRGFYSTAILPDPDWMRGVIERDRLRTTGTPSPSTPQPSPELADLPR